MEEPKKINKRIENARKMGLSRRGAEFTEEHKANLRESIRLQRERDGTTFDLENFRAKRNQYAKERRARLKQKEADGGNV